jgi:ABC-type sugar transport system ATPase subunit
MKAPFLEMRGITKSFGNVRALSSVSFDVAAGEVHALIGENGAGKSTLMNVLGGLFADYEGQILLAGREVRLTHPRQALNAGIAIIYQELSVLPNLTVAENIMLGEERVGRFTRKIDRRFMVKSAQAVLAYLDFHLDPSASCEVLSIAQRYLVEIARAIRREAKVLVFDEPTASLGSEDTAKILAVIKDLRSRGLAIIYISHRLGEIPRIADRVTALRDSRLVDTKQISDCSVSDMTSMMLGMELTEVFPAKVSAPGRILLEVQNLTGGAVRNVSFQVRAGEVVGLAGLVGSGRSEIARAIIGADRARGIVKLEGRKLNRRTPQICGHLGLWMVPEDRKRLGHVGQLSIQQNLNLSILEKLTGIAFYISPAKERRQAEVMIRLMQIEPPRADLPVSQLSGGNQQKVVLGRTLAAEPKVIIFDEPTKGVDVGTKAQIYKLITDLARKGCGVVLISSELIEVSELSHRILIVRDGQIVREFGTGQVVNEESLYRACLSDEAA